MLLTIAKIILIIVGLAVIAGAVSGLVFFIKCLIDWRRR